MRRDMQISLLCAMGYVTQEFILIINIGVFKRISNGCLIFVGGLHFSEEKQKRSGEYGGRGGLAGGAGKRGGRGNRM